MNTTPRDTTPTKTRRSPRQRTPTEPRGYTKAHTEFQEKARLWLLSRPGKQMQVPGDLARIVALGLPCRTCGNLIFKPDTDGHTVTWQQVTSGHWASGIIATCGA